MRQNPTKIESKEYPPERVWDAIVRVTNAVGSEEAKSIRVLLYLVIVGGKELTLWNRFRYCAKFPGRLGAPRGRRLPVTPKNCPLFAFLYDTPANTNNLFPVFQVARQQGWHPNILMGEGVDLGGNGLKEATGSVSVTELMAATTMKEWFAAQGGARRHFAAVSAEFGRQEPQWAKIIRGNRAWIMGELALAMVAMHGLRRLCAKWEPNCVISTSNMYPFDCALFDEALRLGIPSFVIQHGTTDCFWWPFVASKMFLWGKAFENELLKLGAPAAHLAIGGMPAADGIFSRYQSNIVPRSCKQAASYVILSHTQARSIYPKPFPIYKALLKNVVAATPSIHWSIKLHPNEDQSFYREMLNGRFPNFSVLPKSTTLEAAISLADVVCTLWSTAGLEAMIMRRPLVVFDLDPMVYTGAWWPKFGGGSYVNTAEAMLDFALKVSSDHQFVNDLLARQDQFLAENFANPGHAAEAILGAIQEFVRMAAIRQNQVAGVG